LVAVSEPEQLKVLQNEALSKLGCNVLHFQRLESQLKLLVLFCDFQAPLSQFSATHKKKTECIRMKTMGTVASELHERLYGKTTDPQTTKAITEVSLAIGFRVDPPGLLVPAPCSVAAFSFVSFPNHFFASSPFMFAHENTQTCAPRTARTFIRRTMRTKRKAGQQVRPFHTRHSTRSAK
jgi:hypothetical protein